MWLGSGTFPTGSRQLNPQTHRSPNCGARRDGARPDIVVIHYTAMGDHTAARDWLCHADAEVSAHYIISAQGEVDQLVDEAARAWHAGAGRWGDVTDVNSRSIGIELSNTGVTPFAAAQMDALETLLAGIMTRWNITPDRVIGHSDMAPGRKVDPGARFDWARLARRGMAVKLSPVAGAKVDIGQFLNDLRVAGYTADASDDGLLSAFRLRHRQGVAGPLDATDCALAEQLAKRFPVDQTVPSA